MKKGRLLVSLMIMGCISVGSSFISRAEVVHNGTSSSVEELNELVKEYPIEDSSTYGSRRLYIKGIYADSTYGAVQVVYRTNGYTILQYETKEDTEYAYNSFKERGYSVFVDSIVSANPQKIEGYDYHLDNGVTLLEINSLENNEDYTSNNVCVAILDTGIKEDSAVFKRVINQVDYTVSEGETSTYEDRHGTDVAGVIVDSTGDNVSILSLKVLDSDNLMLSEVSLSAAIDYAGECDVDVINMSLGILKGNSSKLNMLKDSIDSVISKGIPVVTASGNGDSNNIAESTDSIFPANYEPCWTVGSVSDSKKISPFSNYGGVDFVAKGSAVRTITCEGVEVCNGTSYSTPYITAFTAIMKGNSELRKLSVDELYEKLKGCCIDLGDEGYDEYYGWGIPNGSLLIENGSTYCEYNGHTYNETPDYVLEPTCTVDGNEGYTCTKCGNMEYKTIGSYGHNYEIIDCGVENGIRVSKCTVCGDTIEESDDIYEHTWVKVENSDIQPTCTEKGKTTYRCDVCLKEEVRETANSLGHDWSEEGTLKHSATCTESAIYTYKCNRCNETKDMEVGEPNGHSIVEGRYKAPTCILDGYSIGYCEVCKKSDVKTVIPKDKDNHDGSTSKVLYEPTCTSNGYINTVCDDCNEILESTVLPKVSHKVMEIRVDATCTEDGSVVSKCETCGDIFTKEVVISKGHQYTETARKEPTETKDGSITYKCSVCGDEYDVAIDKKGVNIAKASLKSVKNSKGRKLTVTPKYLKGYKYQISVSTSKKFTKKTTKTITTSKKKYTFKSLKKGKTYYVRCRYSKKIDGKSYYGSWSKVKKIKVKK